MSSVPVDTPVAHRIRAALRSYAAGDAFGVGYEFLDEPVPVDGDRLRGRSDDPTWPLGAVSDDTLLTVLTIRALESPTLAAARAEFLRLLTADVDRLRGLGPTTRAALGLDVSADEEAVVGRTNGALMRTALLGLGYPTHAATARRAMVRELASATHGHPAAVAAAQLGAALVSVMVERPDADPIDVIEAEWSQLPEGGTLPVTQILEWSPGASGVSLDPLDTLGAVLHVVGDAATVGRAYVRACELGGDTDTVAALAGALVSLRDPLALGPDSLPWVDDVGWAEVVDLDRCASILVAKRADA